jgi:hypothetical protein
MRTFYLLIALYFSASCYGQESLIVYAVKGKATSIINKIESPIKVGNVLPLSSSIKLENETSITFLCKQGIQFVINKAGSFALQRYKDSCKVRSNSVSSNYLSYLWGQMYANSSDHKKENHESVLAVSRGEGKEGFGKKKSNKQLIEFSKGMDTVSLANREFQLCWNYFDFEGFFIFRLYDEKNNTIWKDSTEESYISTGKLPALQTGKIYKWNVFASGAGLTKRRIVKKVDQADIQQVVDRLYAETIPGEDSASLFFRVAYTLEQKHYLGEAFYYYQLAFRADNRNTIIRDRFTRFRNEYYLPF